MKFYTLTIVLIVLVFYNVDAKRYGGGSRSSGGSRGSSSGSRGWGGLFGSSSKPSSHNNAPTSFNTPSHSSSNNRAPTSFNTPSHNTGSHNNPPTSFHNPSAPPYPTNNHGGSSSFGKPPVNDRFQQSSATNVHSSNPYQQQPAHNPSYTPSGGYGHIPPAPHGVSVPSANPPYPVSHPNHPHPTNIGTSSFPNNPAHSPSFPHQQQSSHPVYSGVPSSPGGYHPPPQQPHYNSYQQPHYNSNPSPYPVGNPYQAHYQPATAPIIPGRTVIIQGSSPSKGPGIGSYIASGVAGGVAAGATNAIVSRAIGGIFGGSGSSSHGVNTYPSPPPVGTPTVTNNYYYGPGGPDNNNNNGNNGNNGVPSNNNNNNYNQPMGGGGQPSSASQQMGGGSQQNFNTNSGGTAGNPGVMNSGGSPGGSPGGNPSVVTNGEVSRTPEGQAQNNAPPPDFISDEEFMKFTEELFDKVDGYLYENVQLNLQKRVSGNNGDSVSKEVLDPLLTLRAGLDTVPTVQKIRALYDNYNRDGTQKEVISENRREEENTFVDEVYKTPVMSRALNWLSDKKLIEPGMFAQKDLLKRMWFDNFEETSSGFERIFLSEKFESGVIGMSDWLYFAHLESQKGVNYLGYVDMTNLSGKGALVKLNYQTEGFTVQNATIFVGTPPELELSLYTVCSYARPNNWCPISLGGAKFFILTHTFRYYGKDLIDIGFPSF